MRFDQILGFITELSKDEIFTNNLYHENLENAKKQNTTITVPSSPKEIYIREFRQRIEKINITKELLRALEVDYQRIEAELKERKKQTKK
jgi:hypothetical protein